MAVKEKENPDAKLMLAAGPKLVLAPTQGVQKKKPSRNVPKSQMSTWQALANVFLPENEAPAPEPKKAAVKTAQKPKGPKQYSKERTYFENGAIRSETPYVDGIKHGKERLYFPDGKLEAEVTWVDGFKDGLEKHFFESGTVKSETNFRLDKREGSDTEFFPENRTIRHESYYQNDIIDGTEREFYANGVIKTVTQWSHGVRHGISSSFTSDGHIVAEVPYINNAIDGVVRNYFDNQQLNHETPFKNGVKHGVERCYFPSGKLQRIATYQDGELSGTRKIYYQSGYLESETTYSDGKKNGFDREYYNIDCAICPDSAAAQATAVARASSGATLTRTSEITGQKEVVFLSDDDKRGLLKHEAYFSHGVAEGVERTYYENGNVEQEWSLKNGFWEGVARQYYESGELYSQSEYIDGHREGEEKYYHLTGSLKFTIIYDELSRPIAGRCVCGRELSHEELDAFYSRHEEPTCDHKNSDPRYARFNEVANVDTNHANLDKDTIKAAVFGRQHEAITKGKTNLGPVSTKENVPARSMNAYEHASSSGGLTPEQVRAVMKTLPRKQTAAPGFAPGAQVEPVIPFIIQKPLPPSARIARDRLKMGLTEGSDDPYEPQFNVLAQSIFEKKSCS